MKIPLLYQVQMQTEVSRAGILHIIVSGIFEDKYLMAEDDYYPTVLGVSIWTGKLAKIIIENHQEK